MKNIATHLLLLYALILLAPRTANSEIIDLICTDESGFSINYSVDTYNNDILKNGKIIHDVLIDDFTISFFDDTKNGRFFIVINRANGHMSVESPNGIIFSTYRCERAKPQF